MIRHATVTAASARGGGQLTAVAVLRGGHLAAAGTNLGPATTSSLTAILSFVSLSYGYR